MECLGKAGNVVDHLMGHPAGSRVRDDLRELIHELQQGQFLFGGDEIIFLTSGCFPGFFQDRAHSGVGILGIVNRVFVGSFGSHIKIEVHLGIGSPAGKEVPDGINTGFVHQVTQGNRPAGTFGHLEFLAVLDQPGHLDNFHFQGILRQAQGGQCRLYPGDIAVMVRPPEVNQLRVSPVILVHVVGNIRGEICIGAVALDQHPVLIIAEVGCPQPQGSVRFINPAHAPQHIQGIPHQAAVIQRLFAGPDIEVNPELVEVSLQFGNFRLQAVCAEIRQAFFFCHLRVFIPGFFFHDRGNLDQVRPVVAVFRHFGINAAGLQIARLK